MRELRKWPEPAILVNNSEDWTEAYVRAESSERKKYEHWSADEIKQTLDSETAKKCAYCEGFIGDVSYPHVEHIIPKSLHPELAHSWSNLTLACQKCNMKKSDYFSQENNILNPYKENISEHLTFYGGFIVSKLGKIRGEISVNRLNLNRMELVTSRIARFQSVKQLLERWFQATGEHKEVLAEALVLDANEGEFSASVWAFLGEMGFVRFVSDQAGAGERVGAE
ncbi:HNH endonuclease [Arthrobacter sp. Sr24]